MGIPDYAEFSDRPAERVMGRWNSEGPGGIPPGPSTARFFSCWLLAGTLRVLDLVDVESTSDVVRGYVLLIARELRRPAVCTLGDEPTALLDTGGCTGVTDSGADRRGDVEVTGAQRVPRDRDLR